MPKRQFGQCNPLYYADTKYAQRHIKRVGNALKIRRVHSLEVPLNTLQGD